MQLAQSRFGLTGFQLKVAALVLMVLDHIHYFFAFTGVIPTFFSMLGRLSAPIFLFIVIEGYTHTRSKRKYFLRCWAIGAVMGAVNYFMAVFGFGRADGFIPQNNIFATFAVLIVLWQGMDWLRGRKWIPGVLALAVPFALFAVLTRVPLPPTVMGWAFLAECTVFPLPFLTEGGIPFLISGILMYLLKNRRGLQAAALAVVYVGWNVYAVWAMAGGAWMLLFTDFYEWMAAFAGIFFLLYNGRRGRSMKAFFYAFYPAHVYILFGASVLLYQALAL